MKTEARHFMSFEDPHFFIFKSFQFFRVLPTQQRQLKPEVRLFMSFEDRPFFIFHAAAASSHHRRVRLLLPHAIA
jgi:hypothetical protein